jgi:desulfoferrodoxin-like iron-binding protein
MEGEMKKEFVFAFLIVLVATGLALALASHAPQQPAAPAAQEYSQPKPYTAEFFGPWNAAVAAKHLPEITLEKAGTGVAVRVQVDNHVMDPQKPHWVMWIRLEDGQGRKLGEKTFQAADPSPAVAVFELASVPAKVMAFERCNIHGIWLAEKAVELK